jgi:hypothetical protein
MPTQDQYPNEEEVDGVPHGKHLTLTDWMASALHGGEEKVQFLKERAQQRKDEYDRQQRAQQQR